MPMENTHSNYMIVRQRHLNQYGYLFGGSVLSMVDEVAFIACELEFPGQNFVTRTLQDANFIAPAKLGDILRFEFGIKSIGNTSVTIGVKMTVCSGSNKELRKLSFDGTVIMVCVDSDGKPVPVAR